LFSDIDRLQEGDLFTLNVLGKTLTYQVDQIRTVEPDDLDDLAIDEGADLCTLVTCTPYGVNTHRLLVRGHRVPNEQLGAIDGEAERIDPAVAAAGVTAVVLVLIAAGAGVRRAVARRSAK
jgi:sortase A